MSYTNTGLMPSGKFDNLDGFSSKEVKVKSHDGVMVPLSIIFKRDIQLNGKNPTLVKGYGAYGMVYPVYFNPLNIAWLEKGGVIAVAHVRGGGEYGQEWHHAGQKVTKPNTWKDFIASAEYLISEGYTSKDLIAGQGGSAGGILIGRAITERPDLFAAAIINVGDLDALRAETTTNGVPNIQEFGTVTKEEEFHALLEMSSYHHVVDGTKYPAVLLTHGINDPRVDPWMSGKMAARLQAASTSGKPVLFRVNYSAGHGAGPSRDQYLQVTADEMSFLLWQFGLAK
jgi:prolyl oligopeptidase